MTHNPLSRDFARKLQRLNSLAELVEDTLVAKVTELEAQLSVQARDMDDDQKHELYEHYSEDYVELSDELPTILRYSILTAADTALEAYLNDTCETYATLAKTRIKLGDIAGKGLVRSKDYLKKVAGIAFPDGLPTWQTVTRLHEVRNCIVHAEGYVPLTKSELRTWSGSVPGFQLSGGGVISLKRQFTRTALDTYASFAVEFDAACHPLGLWASVFPVEDV